MKCPVCGDDCVQDAHELIEQQATIFAPCPRCKGRTLNKQKPPADMAIARPCECNKRFIDDVFSHMYAIMVEEGVLSSADPLHAVGMPLVHPGFAMMQPPYLPPRSLVLLSPNVTKPCANRLFAEVPEVRGVIKSNEAVPGLSDIDFDGIPDTYTLLAGCDVRANIFATQNEKVVIYKQQSVMHIEFPRGYDPKIIWVGTRVRQVRPKIFVDACAGPGTLGIIAGLYDIPHVILNDAWYAAAFWSAFNLRVNREHLNFEELRMHATYDEMRARPVLKTPEKIAETQGGTQYFEVYQGDCHELYTVLPKDVDLSVIDLFEKKDTEKVNAFMEAWKARVGGEVFIP
ncbi:MAG: hypothetical protein GKC04_01805 [Methanomicrobiales archaeon]|nr:hypothetical protein [Methanomicrobiales archaeon]